MVKVGKKAEEFEDFEVVEGVVVMAREEMKSPLEWTHPLLHLMMKPLQWTFHLLPCHQQNPLHHLKVFKLLRLLAHLYHRQNILLKYLI
jgi:hypothetical protein